MNQETLRIIDSIARDRNIDREVLFKDIEQAMISAARKHFGSLDTEEFRCEMDRISGEIRLWHTLPAEFDEETGEVINEEEEYEIDLAQLGRIPAQTAKQVMIQRFREDERASIFEEFSKRIGELVTGTAERYEGGALVVQIDRAEGFMPRSEQIPGEQFQAGERVRCLILDVKDAGNQVKIVLSRAHPEFIRRLFEIEVPEVTERIIEIKAMAREPGFRTKLAVSSIDSKVDAVGACVGVRGSRIKNIVDELGGEKIDIVRWNDSSQILIQNALKPAEVNDVSLCFELGRATVIVPDDQLSLAIGKRGQNVRLAARLTGWDIDILTPVEYAKGIETMVEAFKTIEAVSEAAFDRLAALGIISVFDVEEVGTEVLQQELELAPDVADRMVEVAAERGKEVAEEQQKQREEEEARRAEEQRLAESVLGAAAEEGDDVAGEGGLAERESAMTETGATTESASAGNESGEAAQSRADSILGLGGAVAPAVESADADTGPSEESNSTSDESPVSADATENAAGSPLVSAEEQQPDTATEPVIEGGSDEEQSEVDVKTPDKVPANEGATPS